MLASYNLKVNNINPEEQPFTKKEKRGLQLLKTTIVNSKKQAISTLYYSKLVIKPNKV